MAHAAKSPAKRKRRPKGVCPNPMFLRWLEEYRDEAMNNGSKTSYTYNKAMNSIKRYPLPLNSGQEAKILENIGEKIAKMLDRRIAEHLKAGGTMEDLHRPPSPPPPVAARRPSTAATTTTAAHLGSPPPQKRKRNVKEYVPAYRSGAYSILVALYKAEQRSDYKGYLLKTELQEAASQYCDASFTIPKPGTHYTAWSCMSDLSRRGFVERWSSPARYAVTQLGSELASSLLMVQSGGAEQPAERRVPSTAHLASPEPVTTATRKRKSRKKSTSAMPESPAAVESTYPTSSYSSTITTSTPSSSAAALRPVSPLPSPPYTSSLTDTFSLTPAVNQGARNRDHLLPRFSYVDSDGNSVPTKDQAEVTISDKLGVGFLVKCNKTLLESSPARYELDKSRRPVGTSVYAYLQNEDAPDHSLSYPLETCEEKGSALSSLAPVSQLVPISRPSASNLLSRPDPVVLLDSDSNDSTQHSDVASISDDELLPLAQRIGLVSSLSSQPRPILTNHKPLPTTVPSSKQCPALIVHTTASSCRSESTMTVSSTKRPSSDKTVEEKSKRPCTRVIPHERPTTSSTASSTVSSTQSISNTHPSLSSTSASTDSISQSAVDLSHPLSVLHPGQYEVVLCIDNSESSASRSSKAYFRGLLLEELNKNGVKFSVRKLNVGDFLWVAMPKDTPTPLPGQLRQQSTDGAVLEYIVERKRMDDLASSIVDRRFQEQKYRLHQCGVRHLIYLVEEYGDGQHLRLPKSSLQQAITNTQVLDGFFIKQAQDIRESVAYLTVMTRYLESHYRGKTVKVYPVETVQQLTQHRTEERGGKEDDGIVCGMPFVTFNESSVKTKVCTVSGMFAKQLIQVPQSSAARAHAILEQYPTMNHLWQAYKQCSTDKERETLLSNVKAGDNKRKIGKLSETLYALYWRGE